MTRDELEAAIWRRWPTRDPIAAEAVDAILSLIDAYTQHVAGITADRRAAIGVSTATRKRDQRAARPRKPDRQTIADTREQPPGIHGWGPSG